MGKKSDKSRTKNLSIDPNVHQTNKDRKRMQREEYRRLFKKK